MTWQYRTNTTINDPNDGNVRFNNLDLTLATELAIALKTQQGTDAGAEVAALVVGDEITMSATTDGSRWVRVEVTALPMLFTTWASIAVVYRTSQTPTFTDAEVVTLLPIGTGVPVLVTLADAKRYLHITDPARDPEVMMLLEEASFLIVQYIGARADPGWNDTTAPPDVQAATLKLLGHLYEHRGDDASDDHDRKTWDDAISPLLMRRRDPAIA